ncbi:MAG TPA: hypothetical protein VMF50_09110 [Candidatus Binataceae bacterium]|nr:hypothetical protein [Candidatus Binataceae bacterium]
MRLNRDRRHPRSGPRLNCYLVGILLTLCQLGCQKERALGPTQPDAFFPLAPGTTWKYRITDEARNTATTFTDKVERTQFTENGSQLMAEDGKPTGGSYETVVSETTAGSDSQLLMLYNSTDQYIARSLSFGSLEDGSSDYQILSTELEFLPHVLKPGVSWSNTVFPFGATLHNLEIIQTHTVYTEEGVVTVPAGQFTNCIRIETSAVFMRDSANSSEDQRYLKYLDWYAPNVGLVKTTLRHAGLFGKEIARVELIQFRRGSSEGSPLMPSNPADQRTETHSGLMD